MRINIPKFAEGAAASSTLTIVGVCLVIVVAAVPIIAVSFSAMALWKSPETIPTVSGSSPQYGESGASIVQGDLVTTCPILNTLSNSPVGTGYTIANYPKWVSIINDAASGKSAPPALIMAILWHENGDYVPVLADKCTTGTNCDHGWPISSANAYGPFQFQNGTWWRFGMTADEKKAAYDAGLVSDTVPALKLKQSGKWLNDKIFDPTRAAKGAADMESYYIDKSEQTTFKDKLMEAIGYYNNDTVYKNAVYSAYEKLSACQKSASGTADAPPASLSLTEKVLWWARHEVALSPNLNSKPPFGYHTANSENKVKYMNRDVSNSTSVVPGDWRDLGWCVAFVTWVYEKAGYNIRTSIFASPVPAEKFFDDNHTWISQESLAATNPKLLKNSILPGDIIIMHSGASVSGMHAGIVESVDADGRIHTIEGNVGHDEVARRDYTINQWLGGGSSKRIIGFARW